MKKTGINVNNLKKAAMPSKKTLNLAMKEKNPLDPRKSVPLIILVILLACVFCKFAVVDRLLKVSELNNRAAILEAEVNTYSEACKDYDDVLAEYSKYSVSWMDEELTSSADRTDMLDLAVQYLMPESDVRSINIAGNTMSVQLGGITLDEASAIVQQLNNLPQVGSVVVYTAATENQYGQAAAVSMVITMTQTGGEQ